jgi:hypothetical protein
MSFFSWLGLSLLLLLLCSGQLLLAADLGNVAATGEGPANNAADHLEGMTDSLSLWLQQVWEAAQVHLEAAVQAIRYRTGFFFSACVEEGLKRKPRLYGSFVGFGSTPLSRRIGKRLLVVCCIRSRKSYKKITVLAYWGGGGGGGQIGTVFALKLN